jgi:hypothetical protein
MQHLPAHNTHTKTSEAPFKTQFALLGQHLHVEA